jgi:anti-sigma-K factor RskA
LLQRETIEVIGLLPYELAEQVPSAATRERLMAAVRGEDSEQVRVRAAAPPQGGQVVPMPQRTWQSRLLPLAAALIIALLGVSLWQQFAQLQEQQRTIDRLASQLSETNVQETQVAQYQEELEAMQEQLALVTSRGVEVCSLKPRYAAAAETNARGTLFVASDHQHWYLRIDDLEPCPLGRSYQLWFVTEDGTAVDGGVLQIEHGVELEVTSDSMPQGTVEVSITLEPPGGSPAPSGPLVLHGNEVMRLL